MSMAIQETHSMQHLTTVALNIAEQGWVPDAAIRRGIRRLLRRRLHEIEGGGAPSAAQTQMQLIERMRAAPVALVPDAANAQHYEVPVEFFQHVLGPHLKYSSAFWPAGTVTLAEAEAAALRESCAHADLRDGHTILELGCGWGSLTLWMATKFPNCRITAVSNSASQRRYIEAQARALHVEGRLQVMTCADLIHLEDIGRHYAPTLRAWRESISAALPSIRAMGYREEFLRLWELYLCYCEGGFLERSISTIHLLYAKPGWRQTAATC